jgi:hypothetical protein
MDKQKLKITIDALHSILHIRVYYVASTYPNHTQNSITETV